MSIAPKCEAVIRGGADRCKRTARFTAYHPKGNPASEGYALRFCTQHWNSHSLRGWKLWPSFASAAAEQPTEAG